MEAVEQSESEVASVDDCMITDDASDAVLTVLTGAIVEGIGELIELNILPAWKLTIEKVAKCETDFNAILACLQKIDIQLDKSRDCLNNLVDLSMLLVKLFTIKIHSKLITRNPIPQKVDNDFYTVFVEQISVKLNGWDLQELRRCPRSNTHLHKYFQSARRDFRYLNSRLAFFIP